MWIAGIDGCRGGWVGFKVDLVSAETCVEIVNLSSTLQKKPDGFAILAIDIPIGLLDGSRVCDKAARKLLGQPRGSSVFPAPCRASLSAKNYATASATNLRITSRELSQQAWGIASKIKEVDDAITPGHQNWVFEVHPEVSFWALAGGRPMAHRKKIKAGLNERLELLRPAFSHIERHLQDRPSGVAHDDLLDAAVAAWTALRICKDAANRVCVPERDGNGLEATIWY